MERARAVAFEEKPAAKLSILEECKARCADARAKMKADAAKNASKNLGNSHGFSTPDRFRTLDAVKMLPNNRSRSHSASASRHASGARTAESVLDPAEVDHHLVVIGEGRAEVGVDLHSRQPEEGGACDQDGRRDDQAPAPLHDAREPVAPVWLVESVRIAVLRMKTKP